MNLCPIVSLAQPPTRKNHETVKQGFWGGGCAGKPEVRKGRITVSNMIVII